MKRILAATALILAVSATAAYAAAPEAVGGFLENCCAWLMSGCL